MTTASEHVPGTAGIKGLVPEGWHLVSEAAELVGRSADTLTRYRKEGTFIPSGHMKVGTLKVYLYSEADIVELKALAETIRPGPKPAAVE